MELRHLQAFVTVAEELHFGRAATRLQLSPSPVSRTVLELERELGVQLFARSHHRVELTGAGTELLPAARRLLDDWASFTTCGRALGQELAAPRIRIGSPSLAPSDVVDQLASVLAELYPGVPVDVEFDSSVGLLAALRRRELDLAVAHLPVDDPDVLVLPLARYRWAVVVPSHDELARRAGLDPADLAGRRVLQLSRAVQPATMERLSRWLTDLGAIVEHLPDPDLVRLAHLVRHGRGVALTVMSGVTEQVFTQPGLTLVPMQDPGLGIGLGLVWRVADDGSRLVREVLPRLSRLAGGCPPGS
ncbi:LysR family transcriptional regulator [Modestobacter sp. I12A-02628]|uniref:LysR family transcriptional regulator n=1 Tax=Goekera deserti TaxID=2497753 RepID=A0A7K3WCW9_9ACTN|nr:LysR family transcriptional regulator [Goekera deserti]MPQ96936.1 LysR family transcriptional regulator [Goekera deserti]NDI46749.1 LysR family transcriptional regulator [Goekera deserti]NEL54318.1 LysR family transcriptional regulator [Goekera deserti]